MTNTKDKTNLFIVFLRAINVGGKNTIKMDQLKELLNIPEISFIQTYFQSGNMIIKTQLERDTLNLLVFNKIKAQFDLEIVCFSYSFEELIDIYHNIPFDERFEGNKVFIAFYKGVTHQDDLEKSIAIYKEANDEFKLQDQIIYEYLSNGMGNTKITNSFLEKKLHIKATNRNRNTIEKIISLMGNI